MLGEKNEIFTNDNVKAFAQVVWPNKKKSCFKFVEADYTFTNAILSNGYTLIPDSPDAIEQIKIVLKRWNPYKRTYTFYIGKHDDNYVILKDNYQGKYSFKLVFFAN